MVEEDPSMRAYCTICATPPAVSTTAAVPLSAVSRDISGSQDVSVDDSDLLREDGIDVLRFLVLMEKKNAATSRRGIRCCRNRRAELFVSGGRFWTLQHERPSKAEAHVVYGKPDVCVGGTGSKSNARCYARITKVNLWQRRLALLAGDDYIRRKCGDRRAHPELLRTAKTRHSQGSKVAPKIALRTDIMI